MARSQGEEDSQVIGHTFQRVLVAIQRGNAGILAARLITVDQGVDGIQEED